MRASWARWNLGKMCNRRSRSYRARVPTRRCSVVPCQSSTHLPKVTRPSSGAPRAGAGLGANVGQVVAGVGHPVETLAARPAIGVAVARRASGRGAGGTAGAAAGGPRGPGAMTTGTDRNIVGYRVERQLVAGGKRSRRRLEGLAGAGFSGWTDPRRCPCPCRHRARRGRAPGPRRGAVAGGRIVVGRAAYGGVRVAFPPGVGRARYRAPPMGFGESRRGRASGTYRVGSDTSRSRGLGILLVPKSPATARVRSEKRTWPRWCRVTGRTTHGPLGRVVPRTPPAVGPSVGHDDHARGVHPTTRR